MLMGRRKPSLQDKVGLERSKAAQALRQFGTNAYHLRNKYVNVFLLSLPILLFNLPLLLSGHKILPGDPDWYYQIYEAFRISVLKYHQFPEINSWMAGGIPLFANVQFGLISVQAPLVLLFGSVIGLKISVLVYGLIAFFGFRTLFKKGFAATPLRATLLAYIPVFGSFFVYRTIGGHFTFLLTAFVPWLIYLYIKRKERRNWLWFALIYSLMVWSSPHYTTIMTAFVLGVWVAYEIIGEAFTAWRGRAWHTFKEQLKLRALFLGKAAGLILVLSAYRLYFVMQFIKDFPRDNPVGNDVFTGWWQSFYALWGPDQYLNPPQLHSGWGWAEAGTYIGIGTFICLLLVLYAAFTAFRKKQKGAVFAFSLGILIALFLTFFVLGLGDFGKYSPYGLLSQLPVFSSMRVATRWLMWSSLIVLCILAAYKYARFTKIINAILALTVIELFASGLMFFSHVVWVPTVMHRGADAPFGQEVHYRAPRPEYANDPAFYKMYPYDENLYGATIDNVGQVIAGDSLVDTRQPHSTSRCGAASGSCPFISANAVVNSWTPNRIVITRLGPGPIDLDMNPGRGWHVNGKTPFANYKIVDPLKPFTVDDPSSTIILDYAPSLSPTALLHKLGF